MPTYECPTCRKILSCAEPDEAPYRPFCCERCKLIDLAHWLNEDYRVIEEIPDGLQDEEDANRPPQQSSD